jgi:hypothetical protein
MVKELYFAINRDILQTRREGDNARVISGRRGLECSGLAMEHGLYQNLGDIDMCREFDKFKVKVCVIFFGTVGFSLRREGRYFI